MSTEAQAFLEKFKSLPPADQLEISAWIMRQIASISLPAAPHRTIADIAGKFPPQPFPDPKDHDAGFAEAAAS